MRLKLKIVYLFLWYVLKLKKSQNWGWLVGFLNFLFFNFDLKGVMEKCVG